VYSYGEIEAMCSNDVLAMLFWHSGIFGEPIPYNTLENRNILLGPPQSIQSIPEESSEWLNSEIIKRLPY
jgi:hypothetical protein